ncbi:MAG: Gfo/Idh/MocA family oxidoreductase [Candidatus Eisenbacteria bacterium]|uniref:Gfo/Idh/MocA family oxidoreductase n=1 Tax=Eiseniibacteriota bacterium TaxID=2212470 RepID=A0A948RWF3_UNCEI|nr:Gfo/Idh/MocA family oxidoreductase [Candidatus Eisenbacteria bacterium]MBU1949233.1 Gfo/Idh/MocA family oxidoreductase [Candidatus Eisenbacteria bacterium]MBU2690267.1 Gfo/Idh/MocA family oxidoreductase [Candidatus Eisenbacteria bacterium]
MAPNDKIPVAVIGAGHLGTFHARIYRDLPTVDLVGVVDIEPEKAERLARETGCEPFTHCHDILDRVSAVTVATPTTSHHQVALQCLEAGCHVLVEKPIASTADEAEAMIQKALDADRILAVGHTERFNPAFRQAEGLIPAPRFIEAHRLASFVPRSLDIDVVLDLMIHDLDLVWSLIRQPVEQVDASGVGVLTPCEDIANARIRFRGGAVANLTASRISRDKMRKIRIFGSGQYISVDLLERRFQRAWLDETAENPLERIRWESQSSEGDNPLRDEIENFLSAVVTGNPPAIPGEVGLEILRLALQIRQNVRESLDSSLTNRLGS